MYRLKIVERASPIISIKVDRKQTVKIKAIDQVIIEGHVENYKGDYTVIPNAHEQIVLKTKERKMLDNITVKKIPYFDVSNEFGGSTVYIGSEV